MTHTLRKSMAVLICIWTALLGTIYGVVIYQHAADTLSEAVDEARHYYTLNLHYRAWNSRLGGVYASTGKVAPNPYLDHPNRDVTMSDGTEYTLVNPAYMTRMVFDAIRDKPGSQVISKITSLKLLNPVNAPDPWEREALQAFNRGDAGEKYEKTTIDNKPYLRFIAPFLTDTDCLKCHSHQGYKVGDIRGGISIAIPLDNHLAVHATMRRNLAGGFIMLWLLGCSGIAMTGRKHIRQAEEVGTYRDQLLERLTASTRAEAALHESEQRFRKMFESNNAVMIVVAPETGDILDANPAAAEFYGYPLDRLKTMNICQINQLPREQIRLEMKEAQEERRSYFMFPHRIADGSIRTVEVHATPLEINGKQIIFSIVHDISKRQQAEAELREVALQLFQSQKMEAIGQLAGGIAHDFNNLLQVINSFAYLVQLQLQEQGLPVQYAEEITKAGKRAAELTIGLLAFSRKQPINPVLTDMNRIIEDTHKLLSRVLSETIDFSLSYHPSPLLVLADAGQIQQVLINLATNARDAMPSGGALSLATGRAEIDDAFIAQRGYGTRGTYATITVSDTGCGMDKSIRDHIFEPFFTTKEQGKGTGLGLSIVYGIVKQHNGFITVDSRPGDGTTFCLYLREVSEESPCTGQSDAADPIPQGRETILVVDDEEMVRTALGSILEAHGYRVVEAHDGTSAVELFRARTDEIRLVMMDMIMPHMGGDMTLRTMRTIDPDLPALFISGYTEENIQINTQLDGQTALLMKPIAPAQVLKTIRQLLDRKRGLDTDKP